MKIRVIDPGFIEACKSLGIVPSAASKTASGELSEPSISTSQVDQKVPGEPKTHSMFRGQTRELAKSNFGLCWDHYLSWISVCVTNGPSLRRYG